MVWRESEPMDIKVLAILVLVGMLSYSAWLTSMVFCAANGPPPLIGCRRTFFPAGIVHGVGIWFGAW